MKPFKLPEHFLFGTATASLQIEGGDRNNNWYRFCEEQKTKDGTHCFVADDHWNRFEEDIRLMEELNQQTYRMSVEWSRIEPEKGRFSEEALRHYRTEIRMLLDHNIHPLVTLHHFSNPIWFEDMGGWAKKESVECFIHFTTKVVSSLGDLVEEWITINEPNVYLEGTYSSGNFPPGKPSLINYFKGARYMVRAHIEAYHTIHKIRKEHHFLGETKVGTANHIRVFDLPNKRIMANLPRNLIDYVFHSLFMEGMIYGKFKFPIGLNRYPYGKKVFCDFIGINYYSRDIIKFSWNPLRMFADLTVQKGAQTNDMGWEIYPEGLYRVCKKYWNLYKQPIYITENGICDAEDQKRSPFIYDHLAEIKKLIDEGVQIERYYHWSLLDNFEWDEGLTPRFGLVDVDYETQKRTIRRSGHFYGEIAKAGGVTTETIDLIHENDTSER